MFVAQQDEAVAAAAGGGEQASMEGEGEGKKQDIAAEGGSGDEQTQTTGTEDPKFFMGAETDNEEDGNMQTQNALIESLLFGQLEDTGALDYSSDGAAAAAVNTTDPVVNIGETKDCDYDG